MDGFGIYYVIVLIVAAGLAFIPANIAKNKGRSFGLWWFYGWMLFIVALIHSLLLPDPNAQQNGYGNVNAAPAPNYVENLEKLAQLHKDGVLSDEEFNKMKADALSKI